MKYSVRKWLKTRLHFKRFNRYFETFLGLHLIACNFLKNQYFSANQSLNFIAITAYFYNLFDRFRMINICNVYLKKKSLIGELMTGTVRKF